MKINVPEDVGSGELRLLPPGVVRATLAKIMLGKSKANQPKATFKFILLEDMKVPFNEPPTTGEVVLDTYSLQPQALFKLNDTYKKVTGERIPQGDFDMVEFEDMLNQSLIGTEWMLQLDNQIPTDGSSTEERTVIVKKELA